MHTDQMMLLNYDKQLCYEQIGMVGYLPRSNAPSIDIMFIDYIFGLVFIGVNESIELYLSNLITIGTNLYFTFGCELFCLSDMIKI